MRPLAKFWEWMSGKKTKDDLPDAGTNLVDVRDCKFLWVP